MATELNIIDFHYGEYIEIALLGRDREGNPLPDPESQTISMVLSRTIDGAPESGMEWSTVTGEITLEDSPSSKWLISLTPTDLIMLEEGKNYYYNIWSQRTPDTPILQAKGKFSLRGSISPS